MSKVIVDDELRAKLNGSVAGIELCDTSGQALGFIISPDEYRKLLYARARERHSDAEIELLREQKCGRPLNDILRDLGAA
jgi:hypothetical protein